MHAPSEAGVLADPTQEDESLEESSTTVQMDTAKGWAELGVDPRLVAALETKGIKTAFEIQALTVADALAGHDAVSYTHLTLPTIYSV